MESLDWHVDPYDSFRTGELICRPIQSNRWPKLRILYVDHILQGTDNTNPELLSTILAFNLMNVFHYIYLFDGKYSNGTFINVNKR
ncbi:MAG: hypothetical protein J3Q66DRAFT_446302 [Benniella sp.]|nr:MAG: hypothetical protein J3Q66DRAFT_446302 [Benniella sp.]